MSHTVAHDSDPHAQRRGYLAGTDYAPPYLSRFSRANAPEAAVLRHACCGYLSTPGAPPTLLALKQHAQSLCCLIAMLEPHAHDNIVVEVVPRWPPVQPVGPKDTRDTRNTRYNDPSGQAKANGASDADVLRAAAHPPADADLIAFSPFDWLADLTTPYTNDDPHHHRPLNDLVNEVRSHHDVLGTTFHCPLETHVARGKAPYQRGDTGGEDGGAVDGGATVATEAAAAKATATTVAAAALDGQDEDDVALDGQDEDDVTLLMHRPYASHHNLLMHANLCLERLDHEFGATGGLLSLLPATLLPDSDRGPDGDRGGNASTLSAAFTAQEEDAARNSLVGQLLTFTQQLVGRMHELELAYGNALDALRGEAEVPLELAGAMATATAGADGGADGGAAAAGTASGTAAPLASVADFAAQDRWIFTNAGEDVWSFLHAMLDQQGRDEDMRVATWAEQGVISRRSTAGDRLLYVDVNTRYYRVTAAAAAAAAAAAPAPAPAPTRGPLFVCPAWDKHPGLQPGAAERESRPTVVMVPYAASSAAATAGTAPGDNPPPVRVSALEHRYDAQLRAAGKLTHSHARLAQQLRQLRLTNERLLAQAANRKAEVEVLEEALEAVTEEMAELKMAVGGDGSGRKRTRTGR